MKKTKQSLARRLCCGKLLALWLLAGSTALAQQSGPEPRHGLEPQLQQLFDVADRHNSTIRSSQSAVRTAEAAYQSARAAVLPDVEAQLSASYNGNGRVWDRDFTNGHTAPIPHFGNGAGLKVSLPVYTGGALSSGIALSRQGVQMAQIEADAGRSEVHMMITRLYLMLHSLHNRSRVYDENIALARQTTDLMRRRCHEGVVLENDVTRYELMLEQLLLGRTQTVNQQAIVSYQLTTTLGVDTSLVLLPDSAFAAEAPILLTEDDWQAVARDQAYPLRRAQMAIDMGQERERQQRAALMPSVALVAEDMLTGPVTIEIPALNNNFNYWYVGVGVKYNVSSLFKDKRKIRHAQLQTRQARDARQQVADQTGMAVQAAYTDYLTALAAIETHRKSVQLAADSYDVVCNRYHNGLALITDLLDAANAKLSAELKLVDARIQAIENYYQIKYLSGTL